MTTDKTKIKELQERIKQLEFELACTKARHAFCELSKPFFPPKYVEMYELCEE